MLERVVSNWPLKLLALALAFTVWVSVSSEQRIVKDFAVPLAIHLPEDQILTVEPPNTVTVRLRGVESLMRRLDPVAMGVEVRLEDTALGERDVQISRSDLINLPRGAEVEFIHPDRLTLAVDKRAVRDLPVEPTFLGQPPEGFAFYGARVDPQQIVVFGPSSEVDALGLLRTNPIRLDQHREPFVVRVGAVPDGPHVRVLDPRPVEVRIDIDVAPVERRLEDIPIEPLGAGAFDVELEPGAIDVTVSGPPALVDRMLADQLRVLADVDGLEPRTRPHTVELRVELVGFSAEEEGRLTVKSVSRRRVAALIAERSSTV